MEDGPTPVNGSEEEGFVHVQSPLISVASEQTESMGRDAVMECAGVNFSVESESSDPLFEEGQRRLREKADSPEPLATERWIHQAIAALNGTPCEICELCEKSYPDHDSMEFWRSIEESSDLQTRCHRKFYRRMVQRLQEMFPGEPALRNTRTMNLLRTLLHIEGTDDTVEVDLVKLVRVLKFFGPVRLSGTGCALLQQLQLIIDKSLIYNSQQRKEKISWFAGDMSRQESEKRLMPEPEGTYLIRMSQNNAEHGDFALSVKQRDIVHHIEIKGQPLKALNQEPFSSCLLFQDREFSSLVELAEELKFGPVTVRDEDGDSDIWCKKICPGLPLNGAINGYKKCKARK